MATTPDIHGIFNGDQIVPYDEVELKHLFQLIDQIPHYIEQLEKLTDSVSKFAQKAQPFSFDNHHTIETMIYQSFFSNLGNRKFRDVTDENISQFMARLKANQILEGIIDSRNLACEVCGENRSTDRCHIIPNKLGGTAETSNILILCPTHHRLFDRYMLSRAEYATIDWTRKSEPAQHYADNVTFVAHEEFWKVVEKGEYRRVPQMERENIPFVKYALIQILSLFSEKRILKRSSVYKVVPKDMREISKKIVACLVRKNILVHHDEGTNGHLVLAKLDANSIDELALKVWQEIC